MPPPPAEIGVARQVAMVPSPRFGEKVRMRGKFFHSRQRTKPTKTAPSGTRPADAFLLLSGYRHDRSRAERSIARAFHKAVADFGAPFQITQIAGKRAGSVARSTRPR